MIILKTLILILYIKFTFSTNTYEYEGYLFNDTKPLGDKPPDYHYIILHKNITSVKIPIHHYNNTGSKTAINPLVLSIAMGYSISELSVFILSLRKYYNGSVLLFVGKTDDFEFYECLRKAKIDIVNITLDYPYYSNENNLKYPIDESSLQTIPRWTYRYSVGTYRLFFFRLWLEKYGNEYSHIFIGDVRDAIFQGNPFEWNIGEDGLYLTENVRGYSLKDNKWNAMELFKYKYGYEILDNPIICSGAIYGSYKEIKWWYESVTDFMLKQYIDTAEQLTWNFVLYHLNQTEINNHNIYILANEYGPARHLASDVNVDIERSKANFNQLIYNRDNTIPYFIHQYDRNIILYVEYIEYHSKVQYFKKDENTFLMYGKDTSNLFNNLNL